MKPGTQDINLIIDKDTKEVVIRHGKARQVRDPRRIDILGTLSAPRDFWEKRSTEYEPLKCHILFSRDKRMISLIINEKDHFSGSIAGSLKINPEMASFGINSDQTRDTKELTKFLRMRKYYFADRAKAKTIIESLSKFKAKVQIELESFNNDRGDMTQKIEKTMGDHSIPMDFELLLPIFVGLPVKKFKVEIKFNISDQQASLWLESPELHEAQEKMSNDAINRELRTFEGLVVIEQ